MPRPPSARTLQPTARNLALLTRLLRSGELVGVPTETVYGLAANAYDAAACRRIFQAKRRPETDPLIVHLGSARDLKAICQPNADALRLARAFWPGPLTLVLPKSDSIPGIVTAGSGSVAVRVPAHPILRRLLKLSGVPLAAPSANPFGYVSPTTAAHVKSGLGDRIRFILDGGPSRIGLESTIVDMRNPRRPRLLRPGAITRQQLEEVLGHRVADAPRTRKPVNAAQLAPGMLTRHYSPRTPVLLHRTTPPPSVEEDAYIYVRRPTSRIRRNVFWLDDRGDLRAAARRLFALLRDIDRAGFRRIHMQLVPGEGLADAINDRLRRAAARD